MGTLATVVCACHGAPTILDGEDSQQHSDAGDVVALNSTGKDGAAPAVTSTDASQGPSMHDSGMGLDAGDAMVRMDAGTEPPFCGNGHVDPGEECDDGNTALNDACDDECRQQDEMYLVFNRVTRNIELYDAEGVYLDDWALETDVDPNLVFVREQIQAPDGSVFITDSYTQRVMRWSWRGEYLETIGSGVQYTSMALRGDDLLVIGGNFIHRFDWKTGAAKPLLPTVLPGTIQDIEVLPGSWLLTSEYESASLQLREPDGTFVGIIDANGGVNGPKKQIDWLPDGRIIWAKGGGSHVTELLPPSGDLAADAGVVRVNAGGVDIDLPGTVGRTLKIQSGAANGVVALSNGNWFVTITTGYGGAYDPDTGEWVTKTPRLEERYFVQHFYAHAACLDLPDFEPTRPCPFPPPGDAGPDGGY